MRKTTTIQSLLLAGALAMIALPIASAKSYDIALPATTTIGHTQLKAGNYTLKVKGASAVFVNQDNGQRTAETAKIATVARKYDQTAVELSTQGGTNHLTAIELGGSKTKLEFN